MAKKKGTLQKHFNLIWLLPVLLIAIVFLSFKFYNHGNVNKSNQNNDSTSKTPIISTSNWQTYEDSTNGYAIKYSENWNYQENKIEGGAYEGGIMLGDSWISFYENGVTPAQTYMMARGNEKLILRVITDETINDLEESKKIPQTTIRGKPAIKLSTGAYIELSASPNAVLSITSATYPLPEMEEILNSLVISK